MHDEPDTPLDVLLVDDHPLFREGVKAILNSTDRYRIRHETGTSSKALQLAQEERFDLAVIDILLPDYDGIELTGQLLDINPECNVLVVSMTTQVAKIAALFQAGASGYMNKQSALDELVRALDTISSGNCYMDGTVSRGVVEDFYTHKKSMAEGSYSNLTSREREIMQMLAQDHTVQEIADRLFISTRTVENHRSNLMRKLGLKSTLEFFRYAVKQGLIDM